jgi:uncharacterized membrane protein YeiH
VIPELISASGPDVTAVAIPAWLDASAVAVGSVSGVLVATERKLDLVGFIVLAMLGGLGGGLIRDLIIQHNDVYMVNSSYAIPMTVLVGCGGFLFPSLLTRFPHLIEWVDIISVGLFVAAGSDKAIVYHMNPWAVVLMGTVTGVGGGMLRDIFLGDTPRIFQRSNFYAICAVAGSIAFYMLIIHANVTGEWATAISVAIVILMRRLSLHFNILSPGKRGPRTRGKEEGPDHLPPGAGGWKRKLQAHPSQVRGVRRLPDNLRAAAIPRRRAPPIRRDRRILHTRYRQNRDRG